MDDPSVDHRTLPYRIAVLCYLYDDGDRVLLIHRIKSPNAGMYSPIGGKLEIARGESPHECAQREIHEETGIGLAPEEIRLTGIVAETAYEGETHWLIFLFEVARPVRPAEIRAYEIDEGTLEWVPLPRVPSLDIPATDRQIMWPLVQQHRGGFFVVRIDCTREPMRWEVQESWAGSSAP